MLAVLTVESLNPEVYSIVELASEENVRHCERAGADEIIVGAESLQPGHLDRNPGPRHLHGAVSCSASWSR